MKTQIVLLFVGIFAYGYCDPDHDDCDGLAANIVKDASHLISGDPTRTGDDKENQNIDMVDFLPNSQEEFVITRASYNNDQSEGSVCTQVSFGKGCGPIIYTRKFISIPKRENGNYFGVELKGKLKMELKSWTLNLYTLKPVGITQTATLDNEDDLIFKVDSNKFYDLETEQVIDANDVSSNVKDALLTRFAMHHAIVEKVGNEKQVKAVINITCDEKYAWAAYSKKTVDDNQEGKYALEIENKLKYLDKDHRNAGKNEYDFEKVKPLSTTYPKLYRDKNIP